MKNEFGKKITELREAKGLSRYQLSLKAGISASEEAELESGLRHPRATTMRKLAGALGCDYSVLYNVLERNEEDD